MPVLAVLMAAASSAASAPPSRASHTTFRKCSAHRFRQTIAGSKRTRVCSVDDEASGP